MNRTSLTGWALEKALADKLRELLGHIPWLANCKMQRTMAAFKEDPGFDLTAALPLPGGITVELNVECKADPRPSQFPYIDVTHYYQPPGKPQVYVFAAPYIAPRMADVCWSHNWSWFDLAGNCRLSVPGILYIERTGRVPAHGRVRPTANLGTPEAGRVIRSLLVPENASMRWTQRHMEEHFGQLEKPIEEPSLGLINKVVRHLRDEAFIEFLKDGGFRLRDPVKLLFAWRDAYRFNRHERRGYFTLLQGKNLRDALARLGLQTGGFATYAAFSAAEFQAPHVRQAKTWLYVRGQQISKFEELVEAKPVESGENLVVLIPDDDGIFYMSEGGRMGDNRMACTNAVQTYVDLAHCGGRGQEAAEALLEQRLKPEWKRRGLNV